MRLEAASQRPPPADGRYTGRSAVVTGGARGIGLAIARRVVAEGGRVALWDVEPGLVQQAAATLGACAIAIPADVTHEAAVERAAEKTWAAIGRIDLVVNNAGILGPVAPTWRHTASDFRRVVDVNLTGCFLVSRACVPRMLGQEGPVRGRIVNISSIQAKEGMPLAAAYAASKAGVIALTKTLGKELARDGILVNCVTPAAAETDMTTHVTPERRQEILARIPMGRFVEVDEIAAMVAWLGGGDCTFSTGAVFDLSGGRATY